MLIQKLKSWCILYHKQRLLKAKHAADQHVKKRQALERQSHELLLEAALAGDYSITPGMLPKDKAKAIELLRCIVTENYLNLSSRRAILGENSIDWQVELLKHIDAAMKQEGIEQLALTKAQSIQLMNSHLNYLEQNEDLLLSDRCSRKSAA
jgi:hypothetical protein